LEANDVGFQIPGLTITPWLPRTLCSDGMAATNDEINEFLEAAQTNSTALFSPDDSTKRYTKYQTPWRIPTYSDTFGTFLRI